MGMTIPGMTVGATPATSGKVSTAGTGSVTTAVFGQSLQQLMGSTGSSQSSGEATTPTNPLLAALQQLIAAAEHASEDGGTSSSEDPQELESKVNDLLAQLDVLDEELTQNPEMMAMLQGWIAQAQVVLNNQEESTQTEGLQNSVEGQFVPLVEMKAQDPTSKVDMLQATESTNTLEMLAANSATLKFALQDAITQLVDLQKSATVAPEVKVNAQQMLTAFAQTIQTVEEGMKVATSANGFNQTSVQSAGVFQVQTDTSSVKADPQAKTASDAQMKTSEQQIVSAKTQQQTGSGTQQEDGQNQEAPPEFKMSGTVTAGELALRTNGATPAKPVEAVPVHRVAQEVEKLVVERLEVLQKQGFTEAKISLTPDHLGKVDIRITMHAGQLMAHFITENAGAKDLLEQQMIQLRGTLQGQGLTVERLEVTQSSSLQSQMDQNGGQQGNGQQQGRRSRSREESTDDARLTAELGEELGDWLRQKTAAQAGSSFIAEA